MAVGQADELEGLPVVGDETLLLALELHDLSEVHWALVDDLEAGLGGRRGYDLGGAGHGLAGNEVVDEALDVAPGVQVRVFVVDELVELERVLRSWC